MSPEIDRLSPTQRPVGRVVMKHRWSELLFLHWEVPAESMRPLLPVGLELDLFEGRAFIGLVPFTMSGIRPLWAPALPWLSSFHEVNVRTYVHAKGRDPGVLFFSLDAANPVAVWLARNVWQLPYYHARMRLLANQDPTRQIRYESRRLHQPNGPGCQLLYRPLGQPSAALPGTLEHFLAERYLLYTSKNESLLRGRVHHSPYPLQPAELIEFDEDLIAAARIERPQTLPPFIHYASGVSVDVYPLELLDVN